MSVGTLVLLAGMLLSQQPAAPTQPPPAVVPPANPAGQPSPTVVQPGPGDLWLVIYSVLPDRTAEFEAVARQVRAALEKSTNEVRRAQGRDLRVHRSSLPNAEGRHMYFLQIPALAGEADRSGFDVLIDAVLPEQATVLKKQLQSALDPSNPSGNTFLVSVR